MQPSQTLFALFAGSRLLARGPIAEIALHAHEQRLADSSEQLAVFSEHDGRRIDLDLEGNREQVLSRLKEHPVVGVLMPTPAVPAKRPGRPKLGVVSREVSLLPRHWQWLGQQHGGASAALRRLVDAARKTGTEQQQQQRAIEAAHRFLWDIGGNLMHFEEASRALFAGDFGRFEQLTATWPEDIVAQTKRYLTSAPTSQPT